MTNVVKPTPASASTAPVVPSGRVGKPIGSKPGSPVEDGEAGGAVGGIGQSEGPLSPASADAPLLTASDEQSVRVVTVAFNPGEELDRFLASLAAATVRRLTVVIADNGTEHDVVTAAAQRYGARVVGDGTNLGYGAGANLAAADLQEDWLVVANPDLIWRPGSLDVLIDAVWPTPPPGAWGRSCSTPTAPSTPPGAPASCSGAGHAVLGKIWPANPSPPRTTPP